MWTVFQEAVYIYCKHFCMVGTSNIRTECVLHWYFFITSDIYKPLTRLTGGHNGVYGSRNGASLALGSGQNALYKLSVSVQNEPSELSQAPNIVQYGVFTHLQASYTLGGGQNGLLNFYRCSVQASYRLGCGQNIHLVLIPAFYMFGGCLSELLQVLYARRRSQRTLRTSTSILQTDSPNRSHIKTDSTNIYNPPTCLAVDKTNSPNFGLRQSKRSLHTSTKFGGGKNGLYKRLGGGQNGVTKLLKHSYELVGGHNRLSQLLQASYSLNDGQKRLSQLVTSLLHAWWWLKSALLSLLHAWRWSKRTLRTSTSLFYTLDSGLSKLLYVSYTLGGSKKGTLRTATSLLVTCRWSKRILPTYTTHLHI